MNNIEYLIIALILGSSLFLYYQFILGMGRNKPQQPEQPDEKPDSNQERSKIMRRDEIKKLPDIEVMARTMYGEARSCRDYEVELVGHVIMNRKKDIRWPDNITDACLQSKQFSVWNTPLKHDNQFEVRKRHLDNSRYLEIAQMVNRIMSRSMNPIPGCYHFVHNRLIDKVYQNNRVKSADKSWIEGMEVIYRGTHYFLRE